MVSTPVFVAARAIEEQIADGEKFQSRQLFLSFLAHTTQVAQRTFEQRWFRLQHGDVIRTEDGRWGGGYYLPSPNQSFLTLICIFAFNWAFRSSAGL